MNMGMKSLKSSNLVQRRESQTATIRICYTGIQVAESDAECLLGNVGVSPSQCWYHINEKPREIYSLQKKKKTVFSFLFPKFAFFISLISVSAKF